MLTREQADALVEAGIAYLNEQAPWHGELRNWLRDINVECLEMNVTEEDVLGQLFGDYDTGKKKLKLSGEESVRLGFALAGDSDWHTMGDYVILGAAWIEKLRRLKKD
ncbi:hypothetical protein AB0C33_01995 [Nonomuraea sp. NPDC048881]|uniref:hypothetical protein n=1 Tax=Nonomuraea sp. NPDC048881 TaxID=3155030 RepID=UPI0033D09876